MEWNIEDYGLTAQELEAKYEEKYEQHPHFPKKQWYLSFLMGSSDDYWTWVVEKLEAEADELDRDSPYN